MSPELFAPSYEARPPAKRAARPGASTESLHVRVPTEWRWPTVVKEPFVVEKLLVETLLLPFDVSEQVTTPPSKYEAAVRTYLAKRHYTATGPLRCWASERLTPPEAEQPPGADFQDALKDLEGAADEAREDGHAPPAELAMRNARRLLRRMYALRPCRYEVYSTQDREMCIYILEGRRSVLVTCDPDGGARCSISLEGGHSHTYYDRDYAADPPPGFLQEALAALDVA